MLVRIARFVDIASRRKRWIVATALTFALLLAAMLALGKPFAGVVGAPPFDFQNELTVADIAAQIPAYDVRARHLYVAISILDFGFPVAAALLWALLIARGLQLGWPDWYASRVSRPWLALPFLGTIADWTENVANLWLVASAPAVVASAARWSVVAKQAKLASVMPSMSAGLGILALGGAIAVVRSYRADPRAP